MLVPCCPRPATRLPLLCGALLVSDACGARPALAETLPEALLPADSVLYVRWDGFDAHRAAFDKTELGKIYAEELRPLVNFAVQQMFAALGPGLESEKLLEGASPEELEELQKAVKELPALLAYLRAHGLVVGGEMISTAPPRWQLTVVLPGAGQDKTVDSFFGAVRLLAKQAHAQTKVETVRGRKVLGFGDGDIRFAAWQEGPHVVAIIGSEQAERTLKRLDDKTQPTLADSDIFKKTSGFKRYTTYARGYIDTGRAFALLAKEMPPAKVMIDQLGAAGFKRFSFYLGFEGSQHAARLEVVMPRTERQAALSIFVLSTR